MGDHTLMLLLAVMSLHKFVSRPVAADSLSSAGEQLAPRVTVSAASRTLYAVSRGLALPCAANGQPAPNITWLDTHYAPLPTHTERWLVHTNGTLEILPRQGGSEVDVPQAAGGVVRCRAANVHGVALSRDIKLIPVFEVGWEARILTHMVPEGGVAVVTCTATSSSGATAGGAHLDLVEPALWYKDDRVLNIDSPRPASRYLLVGASLLIRAVTARDAGAYSCVARHRVTRRSRTAPPTVLSLTAGTSNSAPRLVATVSEVSVPVGADFCMPCVASDSPVPQYTWYREGEGRLHPVVDESAGGVWLWAGGAALCVTRVSPELAGDWLCKAYNSYGDATVQTKLEVLEALTVSIEPSVVVAVVGSAVRLQCAASAVAARLQWLHNGAPLLGAEGSLLQLQGVTRSHAGIYQCFASTHDNVAQTAAEIRLGESAPELQNTFIEQALRGGSVTLRCTAAAAPPPVFTWLLDDAPLTRLLPSHRYSVSEQATSAGEVVSTTLNVTDLTATDGGRYTCRAHNRHGRAEHHARLNVYGSPVIRALGPVRVVAGVNATVYCPYAGYPISSVSWWRSSDGSSLEAPRGGVGAARVWARGAALHLAPAWARDAGLYTCRVAGAHGAIAARDLEIQVRNPPVISPFIFSSELTEGSSAQVLCGVSSGDKPMYFSWVKDGAPLLPELQIEEKSLNEFSLLMFSDLTARHSGAYTCRVSNHAAAANYTATLAVKVAPSWVREPRDTAVLLGAPLLLECAAKGHPPPTITWYKQIESGLGQSEQWTELSEVHSDWPELRSDVLNLASSAERGITLRANSASGALRGAYRCQANNGVAPALLKHVNLTVHEPARFEAGSAENMTALRGQSVSLTCLVLGDEPLTLYWTHFGKDIDNHSFRLTITEVRTTKSLRSTLQLRTTERSDGGEYRCHARNQHGRSEQVSHLHVDEPPSTPTALALVGAGARWVLVRWRGPRARYTALYAELQGRANSPTRNITLEATQNKSVDKEGLQAFSAKIINLRPAATYSLRIAASNHVGWSSYSEPLLFTTLEEAPTGSPQDLDVKPLSFEELHVSWSAIPRDTWNGELLGYVVSWHELESSFTPRDGPDEGLAVAKGVEVVRSSTELVIDGLRASTRYALSVRAYNVAGAGPSSLPTYISTTNGEMSPSGVRCEPESAQSLRVLWSPLTFHTSALVGFDINYSSVEEAGGSGHAQVGGDAREARILGLRAHTNYSMVVNSRTVSGPGPPSLTVYCSTLEKVPGAPAQVRALPAGEDVIRVVWLPPDLEQQGGRLTYYTLFTRELGKVGGQWSQRVEVAEGEVWCEVRGLRTGIAHEFWVRAATAKGLGTASSRVTATPFAPTAARISSMGGAVRTLSGARVRLACAALGVPPLRRRWSPAPRAAVLTDTGDLLLTPDIEHESAINYTCTVRNAFGSDSVTYTVTIITPPAAPTLRLQRAYKHSLVLAWNPPLNNQEPILEYTVQWGPVSAAKSRSLRVAGMVRSVALSALACGARYRATLRAHSRAGDSPHSPTLLANTLGDKAKAPQGNEFIWANITMLRLNLLSWGGRGGCPVASWSITLRAADGAGASVSRELAEDGEASLAHDLRPATWYEICILARSPAGDTIAVYRAVTLKNNGERAGEAVMISAEAHTHTDYGGSDGMERGSDSGHGWWRGGAAGAAGTALVAALLALTLARWARCPCCLRRCAPPAPPTHRQLPQPAAQHPQLYSTEPGKRAGKLPPGYESDICSTGEEGEISPYATFSMSASSVGRGTLQLHTFGRAASPDLAAPPSRPHLLTLPTARSGSLNASASGDYSSQCHSDSESSETGGVSGATSAPCACSRPRARHSPTSRLAHAAVQAPEHAAAVPATHSAHSAHSAQWPRRPRATQCVPQDRSVFQQDFLN